MALGKESGGAPKANHSNSKESVTAAPPRDLARRTRFRMSTRLIANGTDFFVLNDSGASAFKIDGSSIRTRDTVRFEDLQGNVLCEIRPRLPSVRDAIHVTDLAGERLATVSRRMITPIRDQFTIQIIEGDILDVVGIAAAHEFDITGPDGLVAIISRKWFRVRDSYGVEIASDEDPAIVLAAVVGVDILVGDKR